MAVTINSWKPYQKPEEDLKAKGFDVLVFVGIKSFNHKLKLTTMIADVKRGNTTTETISFTLETCCNCGIPFFMPSYHQKVLLANKGQSFYCPNGHSMSYTGKTDAEKLKEQLAQEQSERAKREEELQNKWLDEMSRANKLEKQLKRVHKGVCPCCNRTFENLKRHMETKHPELAPKLIVAPIHQSINERGKKK